MKTAQTSNNTQARSAFARLRAKTGALALLLLLLGISYACKKESKPATEQAVESPVATPQPTPRTTWLVDSLDTTVNVRRYTAQEGYTVTNIDLNGDGDIDIRFNVSLHTGGSGALDFQVSMETLNNYTSILADSVYTFTEHDNCTSTGKTYNINKLYPKTLSYKDTLKASQKWRQGNLPLIYYMRDWGVPPKTCFKYERANNWPDDLWRYIGVKLDNRVGWIKMRWDNNRQISFYEHALSKQ